MFFLACDMIGKINPNKTIDNVLVLVEGQLLKKNLFGFIRTLYES